MIENLGTQARDEMLDMKTEVDRSDVFFLNKNVDIFVVACQSSRESKGYW